MVDVRFQLCQCQAEDRRVSHLSGSVNRDLSPIPGPAVELAWEKSSDGGPALGLNISEIKKKPQTFQGFQTLSSAKSIRLLPLNSLQNYEMSDDEHA